MLYRETIVVCSQIHIKHINTVCRQNIQLLNIKLEVYIVNIYIYICVYIYICMYVCTQFVLCCALQAHTLQCSNCSQQTIAKGQQSIYCVIRISLPVSSRHIITSSITE